MGKIKKDSLGDRMKTYEAVSRFYLTRRMPVIIRLDGKAFHTFTRGMKKPCDPILTKTMQKTMKALCENIQGCVLGYTQSDEITLVLVDYQTIDSCAWFDNQVQKMASVSASMATMYFNKFFREEFDELVEDQSMAWNVSEDEYKYADTLYTKLDKAMFDARVFNLPREEVINCLIWRQQDATRNSIQAAGQYYFSHKELQGKTCNDIQDMLFLKKGVNWSEDYATVFKRGSCCIKVPAMEAFSIDKNGNVVEKEIIRSHWEIDTEIPIFTQDRDYINSLVGYKEN